MCCGCRPTVQVAVLYFEKVTDRFKGPSRLDVLAERDGLGGFFVILFTFASLHFGLSSNVFIFCIPIYIVTQDVVWKFQAPIMQ